MPTVVQSLNRQIIQSIGISRDSLHYNTPTLFYPLAEISAEDTELFNASFNTCEPSIYSFARKIRDKYIEQSNKAIVPTFFINQIVFVRDQAPSVQGVSSVLKIPTKGPFRIKNLEDRNVTIEDIETGKTYYSHVELICPLLLKEFKLLLNKNGI